MSDIDITSIPRTLRAAELGRRYTELLAERNTEAIAKLFRPDAQWELRFAMNGVAPIFTGQPKIARLVTKVLGRQLKSVDVFDVEITDITDDLAWIEWRTQCRDLSDREYSNVYAVKLTARDGLIWRWREYFDPRAVESTLL